MLRKVRFILFAVVAMLCVGVVAAHAQDGGVSLDPDALIVSIAAVVNMIVVWAVTKWVKPLWDKLPDVAKGIIVGVESAVFVFLSQKVGLALGGDIFGWTPDMWQAVLVWGMSMGWHRLAKGAGIIKSASG